MKVTMRFDLDEEREEFEHAINSGAYICALHDMYNYLRHNTRYSNKDEKEIELLEEVRDRFFEFLNNRGIDL